MEAYKIKLDAFEGPLDLLMHLIEKNKINIYDIPIAEITEQYMGYLEQFQEFNIEIASGFLVMAATLLQIKSRVLLPKTPKSENDIVEEEIDPRQELVERLLEYKRFKEVSEVLDQLAVKQAKYFFKQPESLTTRYLPLEGLPLSSLVNAFKAVLSSAVEEAAIVERDPFTIEEKMEDIIFLLHKNKKTVLFTDTFSCISNKAEMVTTFLALLELIKLKRIFIEQQYAFAPIYIKLKGENDNVL